jgi:hypothetical protein
MRSFVLALLLVSGVAAAAPAQLMSNVTRVPLEPVVVVVPANSGKTVVDRFRSHATPTSGTPLVVIVRLPDANTPDTFAVTDAHRDGTKIVATIESRRYTGPLGGNEVTTPLVEVILGDLPKGSYTIDIDERILHFAKIDAPQSAGKPARGLSSSITLLVQ